MAMTPTELQTFRQQRGWTRIELARRLEISVSRLKDYELGHTRTTPPRPALIPRAIVDAVTELAQATRPLSTAEKLALLYDTQHLPRRPHGACPVDRSVFYGAPRGR